MAFYLSTASPPTFLSESQTMLSLTAFAVALFAVPAEEIELFNGKDFTGWKHYIQPESSIPEKVKKRLKLPAKFEDIWKVEDGMIVCKGQPYGYLFTEKEFDDFELALEWRWKEGSTRGNSGVLLFVVGEDKIWPKSIEAQLASGQAGDFWLIDRPKFEVSKSQQDPRQERHYFRTIKEGVEKPVGEWNKYQIVCKDGDVKLTINGKLVNEGKNADPKKGRIALQSEGTEVHFRNIKLKTLE
jgi:hypothetical protein